MNYQEQLIEQAKAAIKRRDEATEELNEILPVLAPMVSRFQVGDRVINRFGHKAEVTKVVLKASELKGGRLQPDVSYKRIKQNGEIYAGNHRLMYGHDRWEKDCGCD